MSGGLIFDIKRYAIHDGPGIRVTLFFKGCPLDCIWCHNPEGKAFFTQKLYTASRCIGARECVSVCPRDALTLTPNGIVTDVHRCNLCGDCAPVCPTRAIEMSGKRYDIDQILAMIEKEQVFIDASGGGVTFSGGEPLHHETLLPLLEACGKRGLHRTVDTSGHASGEVIRAVAPHTDLWLYDIKHMDPNEHKRLTGQTNDHILANLRLLAETGAGIIIRIPLVAGFNCDEANIRATAAFIASLPGNPYPVNLLPYHDIARNKYAKMGQPFHQNDLAAPDEYVVHDLQEMFAEYGLTATVGG